MNPLPEFRDFALEGLETALELLIGASQAALGIGAEKARQIGRRKQQVPHLLFDSALRLANAWLAARLAAEFPAQLLEFFFDLVQQVFYLDPVEPSLGSSDSHLVGLERRWQGASNPIEQRPL